MATIGAGSYYVYGNEYNLHRWFLDANTVSIAGAAPGAGISGEIIQCRVEPWSVAPTSGFAVQLRDSRGFDWLFDKGAAVPSSAADRNSVLCPFVTFSWQRPFIWSETLTPYVTGIASGDSIKIELLTRP
jgi:hypothetical protein